MLLRILINFGVFALVSSSQVLQKRQGLSACTFCNCDTALTFISGGYDITRSGRYAVVNCGNRDAARLVSLLDTLWNVLQPVRRDVSRRKPSPALTTFFTSAINGPYVSEILKNITTGVSLYPPEQKFDQTGSPLLICVTGGGQVIGNRNGIDYYYQCVLDPQKSLIAIGGSPYIVVCPHFLLSEVPDVPTRDTCLTLNTYVNRFRGTGSDFTDYKIWTLLDGILRYYIYATTGFSGTYATDVNMCTRLRTSQNLKNPSNYVYYVASERFSIY